MRTDALSTIAGHDRSVGTRVVPDANSTFCGLDEVSRFLSAHVGDVVDILRTVRAVADSVISFHFSPTRWTRFGYLDLTQNLKRALLA